MNERTIFENALDVDDREQREAYVKAACGQNMKLRSRVKALLHSHDHSKSFLGRPALEVVADGNLGADLIGTQIGPYKLREQIGEGGMGVVYVAEQTKPVRRKVALKIIRPGMASSDVTARFEAERQALAMMDHPNIAKVLDAGTTDTGQLYFVMELVKGLPITEYCDEHQLDTRARLELFLEVCRAVQHAHQKGIIHRDLKPSNILVPRIDGAAVPKVIDFGVAKAIGEKLTPQTVYTQFSQLVGTPLYMSPEQTEFGVIDIDTRTDVYSLGVLLYELLTGTTPFDSQSLKEASFDEMRRIIREDDPQRPSARVSTLNAKALSTVSQQHGSDPRTLSHALKGELDWIVMRALEKDRNRRYESASALAEDVERFLRDEPITARPASRWYRIRKFARRNRALVTSTAAVLLALATGLALATFSFLQAERRLAEVTAEQENNRVLIKLLSDMYPSPWGTKTLGRNHTVYQAIEEISPALEKRLRNHPTVEIEVRNIFATAYSAAGDFDKARENWDRALKLAIVEFGTQDEIVAHIHAALADEVGWNYDEPLNYTEKLQHAEKAIEIYESLGIESSRQLCAAWFAKGHCLLLTSPERKREAEEAQRKCVEIHRRLGDLPVIALWDLGLLLMDFGDDRLKDAEVELRSALKLWQMGKFPPMHKATALSGMAECLRRQGDISGAINHLKQSWEMFQADDELQSEPRGFRVGLSLVETLFAQGDVQGAFDRLRQIEGKLTQESAPVESLVSCQFLKGWLYFQLENYQPAEVSFRKSIELAKQHIGEDRLMVGVARGYLAMALEGLGRDDEAAATFRRVLPIVKPFVDTPHVRELTYWTYTRAILGWTDDDQQLASALDAANRGIDFLSGWPRTWLEPAFHHVIAGLQVRLGDRRAAVNSLTAGLEKTVEPHTTYRSSHTGMPTTRRDLELMLAGLYLEDGEAEEARKVLQNGVLERKKLGENHIQVALAQLRMGEFLVDQSDYIGAKQPLEGAFDELKPHPDMVQHLRRRAAAGLVEVYQATARPDKAAEWQSTLEAPDPLNEDNGTE